MRKLEAPIAIFALLLVAITTTQAASAPKPGSKCAKAGLTQTISGKKYLCIKSGSNLTWNKGVIVTSKTSPSASASAEPSASPIDATPSTSASPSPAAALVKFKNCAEAKAAGASPLTKAKTPELYELNIGLDRDKDGIACET